MADPPAISADTAKRATQALLVVLAELIEAADALSSASSVLARTQALSVLCRDAAAVADTLGLIVRRSAP